MWRTRLGELSERPRVAMAMWWSVVALLSLLHLFLNANDIGGPELWLDESSTWGVARRPLLTVLTLPTEFHSQPPLYYVVLHFLIKIYDARWFMRGFGWLSCLALVQFVLFYVDELGLPARVLFCFVFINASLTRYLSTALRPYALAALLSFVSTVLFLRLLRDPSRRRAIHYALAALGMLYTMAFDVWVGAAQGICLALFLSYQLFKLGLRPLLTRYRPVLLAMAAVIVGYLPYLAMAIHWQYRKNASDNGEQVLLSGHYTYIFKEHFAFAPPAMLLLYALVLFGLWAELRAKKALSALWILVALGQVGFVVFFMIGRGLGPTGRYITPALPAACYLAALGFEHLVPRAPRVAWQFLIALLAYIAWPNGQSYAANVRTPTPLGPWEKLRAEMKAQPGKKLIFFDIGYAGQDFEYVIRRDPDISTATMRGPLWASGGDDHLDADYVKKTIEATTAETRCYYYSVANAKGVYATTFVPELERRGYSEVITVQKMRRHCQPEPP